MSANNDAAFLRMFLVVLGALLAFTILIMFLAGSISSELDSKRTGDSRLQAAIAERIKPVGKVEIAKPDAPAVAEPSPAEAVPAAPAVAAGPTAGKDVYTTACLACHMSGAAGAPKLGDTAAWSGRIAQGMDALVTNAINGKGTMPPKGGRMDLSDDAIKAAIEYMVEGSQ